MTELNEPVLADDYPMHGGYLYVIDGKPRMCEWMMHPVHQRPMTVAEYRQRESVGEVRRCDIMGRQRQYDATRPVKVPHLDIVNAKVATPNPARRKKKTYKIKNVK